VVKSSFNYHGKPQFAKSSNNHLDLIPKRGSSDPPSIPAKFQSHGYEVNNDGTVKLQPPAIPGYSGRPGDQVGPGDYNPKIDVKFRNQPKSSFPKVF
jgi:hypothetical protein